MQTSGSVSTPLRSIRRIVASAQPSVEDTDGFTFSLLGKIIFKNPLDHEDVKKEINNRWRSYRKYEIITKGTNLFLFRFQKEDAFNGVRMKTWDIMGYLLSLIQYDPNISISEHKFEQHVWTVKLRNLGNIILNDRLTNEICKDIGIKVNSEGRRRQPRGSVTGTVYIEVKLTEPLGRGGWYITPTGKKKWVIYHFEMQPYEICKKCWVVDHEDTKCKRLAQEQKVEAMTEAEYAEWSQTEEGKKILAAYITIEDANIMDVGVEISKGTDNTSSSSTTPFQLSHNGGILDLEIEDAEMRKNKRTRETSSQIKPTNNTALPHNLNSRITHNNPIYQSPNNGSEEMIDYSDLSAENRMEYQLNSMDDNRSKAIDSAESEHMGAASRNHYGNAASANQVTSRDAS
ncbi:uncharacterized protein LOC113344010 isoform X2 [Papaver somniferum]|uniref:uncharacterized protein LOC113344010 isoform X2 n=1 Tax=Papaver somniferum TaxID=3469 RepID=UPI000E6FC3A3|nr:uncharacterized protein LOC113344010 isoform X2 [Papaver somniferum]